MRLPTELKLKILESVSCVDIAKVSCVCSELRFLGGYSKGELCLLRVEILGLER
ncbi:putative F-box domain-containing protein [Helianthus annuus]|nr:putative F-box domain-containing protein [Helianthus annuus]